jgi:HEAT repeat protein
MANEQDTRVAGPAATLGSGSMGDPGDGRAQRGVEQEKVVVALLRQLASGLSAYRMFPGDLKQPAFVQVVLRIRAAAQAALEWGSFEAEINGSRFTTSAGPVPADERIERLALSLYQHRAERFLLRGVPDAQDLGVLYGALSKEVSPDAANGVGAALRVGGVETMVVREVTPQPLGGVEPEELITDEQRALWEKLGNPVLMSRELLQAVSAHPSTAEAAQEVFARFERLLRTLPPDLVGGFEFYGRLHEVIVRLPKSLRRAVMTVLLSKVRKEPLAERLIGTMTDADLARVLVDQSADGGADPIVLARFLVQSGVRGEDLVELTDALKMGIVEGGTILAGLERVGIRAVPSVAPSMAKTVSSLLARGLLGVGQEDVEALREAFPSSTEQLREVVFAALTDYLRAETDRDRLTGVLAVWSEQASAALRQRDEDLVRTMLKVMDLVGGDEPGPEKKEVVDATLHRVLSRDMLAELVSVTGDDDAESTIRLLRPFGDVAVDDLMDDLAEERDRGRRAVLLGILCEVARGHHRRVARRLSDHRWFVARNAVTVLYRSGDREVVPLLAEASRHNEPAVRREAARGLLAVAGLEAMPELMVLAIDPDESVRSAVISAVGGLSNPGASAALARLVRTLHDPSDRRRAIDALARHPAPEASDVLAELASSRSRPKLPLRIRRYAKGLSKRRREGNL